MKSFLLLLLIQTAFSMSEEDSEETCSHNATSYNFYQITFSSNPFSIIFLLLLTAILFLFMGLLAGNYMCPNLNTIGHWIGLKGNILGVTFLAYGNGAPDLFSTFGAFQENRSGLAVGELLGAGMFITTFVIGLIAIYSGFKVERFSFLRDGIFFIGSLCILFLVLLDSKVTMFESCVLIGWYILYVLAVVFGSYLYQAILPKAVINGRDEEENLLIEQAEPMIASQTATETPTKEKEMNSWEVKQYVFRLRLQRHTTAGANIDYKPLISREEVHLLQPRQQLQQQHDSNDDLESPVEVELLNTTKEKSILFILLPIIKEWKNQTFMERLLSLSSALPHFIMKLTVPVIETEEEDSAPLLLHCLTSPVLLCLTFQTFYPLIAIPFLYLLFHYQNWKPFSIVGFLSSLSILYLLSQWLLDLLHIIGCLSGISDALLGLTLFAVGNSVSDAVSNIVLATYGFAHISVGACFGAPMLNIMLGIGFSTLYYQIKNATSEYDMPFSKILMGECIGLMISLTLSVLYVVMNGYSGTKKFGWFLLLAYGIMICLQLWVF